MQKYSTSFGLRKQCAFFTSVQRDFVTARRVTQFTKRLAGQHVTTPFMVWETSLLFFFRASLELIYFNNSSKSYGETTIWFLSASFLGKNNKVLDKATSTFPSEKRRTGFLKEKCIQDRKMARKALLVFFLFPFLFLFFFLFFFFC